MTKDFKELLCIFPVIIICNFGINFLLLNNLYNLAMALSCSEAIVFILMAAYECKKLKK